MAGIKTDAAGREIYREDVSVDVAGGGGGGSGDASAANQNTQIAAEQAIRDEIGAVSATPIANTLQARLLTLANLLTGGLVTSLGQKTMANSPSVVIASDQTAVPFTAAALTATSDRSGTATTTSGGLSVAANANRKFLVGQNLGTISIGFNEQGGTAAINTAGTYTVAAGQSFSISTNKLVNFIAASGTVAVTMTEG